MPISFTDLSDQIELNEKRLDDVYKRYESYQTKFSVVSVLYSVMALYLIPLIKYGFSDENTNHYIFCFLLIVFFIFFSRSIHHSFNLLRPKDVGYQELPKAFYIDLANEYREKGIEEEELDEYIKTTYNNQLETILDNNSKLVTDRSRYFLNAFYWACLSIIPYLLCISLFLFGHKSELQSIELKNYKQVIQYLDSTNSACKSQKK